MRVDLGALQQMHPRLPSAVVAAIENGAAVALQRRHHEPGVELLVNINGAGASAELEWGRVSAEIVELVDRHRITEEGAEAVALALSSVALGLVVRRRLQRGEFADWLLEDVENRRIALEVSGIDGPPDPRRLAEKLRQVSNVTNTFLKWACVVSFGTPTASLAMSE